MGHDRTGCQCDRNGVVHTAGVDDDDLVNDTGERGETAPQKVSLIPHNDGG